MPDAAIHDPAGQALTFFGHLARTDSRMDHTRALRSFPVACQSRNLGFMDCHAIENDLPVDHDEFGFVQLIRTCGRSTSAWCQLGNGLKIVNGRNGQWKRLSSGWGMLLMC